MCPACGHVRGGVIDSRPKKNRIVRRRRCIVCSHRYSTEERSITLIERMNEAAEALGSIMAVLEQLRGQLSDNGSTDTTDEEEASC